ncbi:NAD(P)-dependent alcohol dehydrogenase [Paenibacillus sp. NPDC058174]|uniref:NAD(P)-dependent alcohol dehydrogenase n=1 Tax=Paenibacillus sp. NPDC058174 TaxID=3346366 RepID=UPI0036DF15FB
MKAVVFYKYGGPEVLSLQEVDKPALRDREVRIRIYATTVSAGDCRVRSLTPPPMFRIPMRFMLGFNRPRNPILGIKLAGEIEAAGSKVTRFRKGDPVFGPTGFRFGAYAEYICLPENSPLAIKPSNLTYAEAAAVPVGGLTALGFLRKACIQPGQKVLVYGASGSLGTYAVQLSKHFGAEVTAVCSSANLELVKSLGADHVIDYAKEDFAARGETYHIIFDTVGKTSFEACIRMLKEHGSYVMAVMSLKPVLRGVWTSMTSSKKVISGMAGERTEDLDYLRTLIEKGKLKPVIDRSYPLEQMAEAHRYVDTGRKKGNVVITINDNQ